MDWQNADLALFFARKPEAWPLFEAFAGVVFSRLPETVMRVQKTQITFSNRHVFACVSFLRVRRKSSLPEPHLTITLGLPHPLDSERVAAQTEPWPGRWTCHIVIGSEADVDDELVGWLLEAADFAEQKGRKSR
ncbi:MAG: DUF5655 domain-containing protein [Bacillota bacterium]|nr:DUF5655 domain-containing protein [Bacillota bacterium]